MTNTKTAVESLTEARARIEDPDNWTKGDYYDLRDGKPCFCALGAVYYQTVEAVVENEAYPEDVYQRSVGAEYNSDALGFLFGAVPGGRTVPQFNDDRNTTHADVLGLFDRAIEAAREQELLQAALERLEAGRARIANEWHWTRGTYYQPINDDEMCFCALGSIDYTDLWGELTNDAKVVEIATQALAEASPVTGPNNFYRVTTYNDDPATTHADVLAMFDTAIASLKEKIK